MILEDFHFLVGQTIMYCQIIEHDQKRIYASLLKGNYYDNLDKVDKWSFGEVLKELKALDFSDDNPYISTNDYNFLKQMKDKRNHLCHQAYQNFMYNKQLLQSKEYANECRKIQKDNEIFAVVYKNLEVIRIKVQKDFRGI